MKRSSASDRKSKKSKTSGRGFKPSKVPRSMPSGTGMRAGPVYSEVKALSLQQGTGGPITASYNFDTTGTIQLLNGLTPGNGFSQRNARRIQMKSLKVQFNINPLANRTAPGDLGRIMIIYDRQTNGALPSIADILQDTSTVPANVTSISSGPNLGNRERFYIIRDYKFTLPAAVVPATGVPSSAYPDSFEGEHQSFVQWYIKLKNLDTVFIGDDSLIGSIGTGSLLAVTLGGVAPGVPAWGVTSWHSRLRYYDN